MCSTQDSKKRQRIDSTLPGSLEIEDEDWEADCTTEGLEKTKTRQNLSKLTPPTVTTGEPNPPGAPWSPSLAVPVADPDTPTPLRNSGPRGWDRLEDEGMALDIDETALLDALEQNYINTKQDLQTLLSALRYQIRLVSAQRKEIEELEDLVAKQTEIINLLRETLKETKEG